MNVASAQHGRHHYGVSGLRCLGCSRLFKTAGAFVLHPCFKSMLEREEAARSLPVAPLSSAQQLLLFEQQSGG